MINLFSVELKNQPGELAHLDDVCAQRGVNHQLAGAVSGARDHPCSAPATTPPYAPPWRARAWSSLSVLLQVTCADQPGQAAKGRPEARRRGREHRGSAGSVDLPR